MSNANRQRFLPYVQQEAARAGIPWELLDAAIMQESSYNPAAVGDSGNAIGLGQMWIPAAQDVGLSPQDRYDPYKNIRGSADYLAMGYQRSAPGDRRNHEALARYNAGVYKKQSAIPAGAWRHADNAMRFYQGNGGPGSPQAVPYMAAQTAPAPQQATFTSSMLGIPANFAGVNYADATAQVPAAASPYAQAPPLAQQSGRPRMSLNEILRYADYQPPDGFAL